MKLLSMSLAAVMFMGLAATPSLFAEKSTSGNDKPEVVCPDSNCTMSCCKKDAKNRMDCQKKDCGKEKSTGHEGH